MGVYFSAAAERAAERERQKQVSLAIDLMLEEDNKRLKKECKVLVLGKLAWIHSYHCPWQFLRHAPTSPSLSGDIFISFFFVVYCRLQEPMIYAGRFS